MQTNTPQKPTPGRRFSEDKRTRGAPTNGIQDMPSAPSRAGPQTRGKKRRLQEDGDAWTSPAQDVVPETNRSISIDPMLPHPHPAPPGLATVVSAAGPSSKYRRTQRAPGLEQIPRPIQDWPAMKGSKKVQSSPSSLALERQPDQSYRSAHVAITGAAGSPTPSSPQDRPKVRSENQLIQRREQQKRHRGKKKCASERMREFMELAVGTHANNIYNQAADRLEKQEEKNREYEQNQFKLEAATKAAQQEILALREQLAEAEAKSASSIAAIHNMEDEQLVYVGQLQEKDDLIAALRRELASLREAK